MYLFELISSGLINNDRNGIIVASDKTSKMALSNIENNKKVSWYLRFFEKINQRFFIKYKNVLLLFDFIKKLQSMCS